MPYKDNRKLKRQWRAVVVRDGIRLNLGFFSTKEEAEFKEARERVRFAEQDLDEKRTAWLRRQAATSPPLSETLFGS